MRSTLATLALLAAASLATACGNPTADACNRWRDALLALDCVPDDYDVGIECTDYNDYPCDASPYFDCLESGYSCDAEGNFQQDTAQCLNLAGCS
jgi:hypothetical protein